MICDFNDFCADACVTWNEFIVDKRPNYDFCISQSSVATVLRWGAKTTVVYVKLLLDAAPTIITMGKCVTELFNK